jgi:hypothetical protein
MDFEKQDKFFKRFPDLFIERNLPATQTGMCWGIDTGDGWFDLLWGLCERLETFKGLRFTQVKEKFGGIRVYYRLESKPQSFFCGLNSRSKRKIRREHKRINYLIEQAENTSYKICEFCGKNADGKSNGYWDPTSCEDCRNKRNADKCSP